MEILLIGPLIILIVHDILTLFTSLQDYSFSWIPRNSNGVAHGVAFAQLQHFLPSLWVSNHPSFFFPVKRLLTQIWPWYRRLFSRPKEFLGFFCIYILSLMFSQLLQFPFLVQHISLDCPVFSWTYSLLYVLLIVFVFCCIAPRKQPEHRLSVFLWVLGFPQVGLGLYCVHRNPKTKMLH